MNNQIETLLSHRSIRKFTKKKLSNEQIQTILQAASMASTSSYMMAYTIIGVTDEIKKEKLASISGQPYVKENGHLLIFCADLNRNTLFADQTDLEKMKVNLENTEHFLVATIDASLAAQNAAIAAEALGLGICYLGSIRNNIEEVDRLLNLPNYVIPLFGMAIGEPDYSPEKKPRLPIDAFYSENSYMDEKVTEKSLNDFDQTIASYYQSRSSNNRNDFWTDQMKRKLIKPNREDVGPYTKTKKLNKS
ncbi:oxygen-insensitive NADPH nitroreductase [Aquibacillus salsiterrae]|uniref:Oxygen-insensitive NADPH nitroreductase n=1 Tax=Aquibacillus salsiterrae TaxID=2950439 RepID=A0A9X4AEB4_9BACI|nr:oxygen-insensitive NADPH nitroreductase [Aquibacillus salsiterrae]MDC3416561.1 oxygen-insensitive NADPH nitroreductase [Aquibacillus salsiterrae]